MSKQVLVLEQAAQDLKEGMLFYNSLETGVGDYFRDSILSDIRRLGLYAGIHRQHFGFCRCLASRFPYAIYYSDQQELRQIVAIIDLRRDPRSIHDQLAGR